MSEGSPHGETRDGALSPERQAHAGDIHTTPADNPNTRRSSKRGRPRQQKQPVTQEENGDDDGEYRVEQSESELSEGTQSGSDGEEEPEHDEVVKSVSHRRATKGASSARKNKAVERRTRRGANTGARGNGRRSNGTHSEEDGSAGGSNDPHEDHTVAGSHPQTTPDRALIPQGELLFPLVIPSGVERTSPAFIARIQQPSFQAGLRLMLEGSGHIRECRAAPWDHVNNCICNLDPSKSRRKASVIVSETDLMMFPRRQFDEFVHRAGLERPSYSEYMRFLREQWLSADYTDRRLPDHTCELGRGRLTEFRQLMSTAGLTANGVRFLKEERDRSMNRRHQHAHRERTKVVSSDRSGPTSPRSARARGSEGGTRSSGNGIPQQGPGYQGLGAPSPFGPFGGAMPSYPFGGMMPFNVPGMYPPLGMGMDAPALGGTAQGPPPYGGLAQGPAASGQQPGGGNALAGAAQGPGPASVATNPGGAAHTVQANPAATMSNSFQGVGPGASTGGFGGPSGLHVSPNDGGMGQGAASGAHATAPQAGPLGFPRVPWDQYLALQAMQMQLLGGARPGGAMMNMMGGLSASPAQIQQLIATLQQQQQQLSGHGSNGHSGPPMGAGVFARSSSPNAIHTLNELDAARHLSSMFNKNTAAEHS